MGSAEVYGFVAVRLLILTLLANSSAACYCDKRFHKELWKQACVSDFVVQGRFADAVIGQPRWNWARYIFETSEIFKKPESLEWSNSLYTQLQGYNCGYKHEQPFHNLEFVVTGYMAQDIPAINVCSFIKLRKRIPEKQIQDLRAKVDTECEAWLAEIRG
ncbi:metalloproteinase inhibitor 1-like isoform X2 [Sphaerodactylus townsendi]|uniref:metalloproteinase inhibitor 1-like isoform X2 n=1 Tax=Sphaerodactylus townsendi TaxID=933632 RepID=UPI00202691A0|nr:metalloproteinase inhibitor 1-like isoform X2 [Sphaerodactylus townsendi]